MQVSTRVAVSVLPLGHFRRFLVFALLCLLMSFRTSAHAQCGPPAQLTPNPNPAGNTINSATDWCTGFPSSSAFYNFGTVNTTVGAFGQLYGKFINGDGGLFNNNGGFGGYSGLVNDVGGVVNNTGLMHPNGLYNDGTINNSGSLSSDSSFVNSGLLNNNSGGIIRNIAGAVENTGTLNNNFGATVEYVVALFNNTGTLNNYGSIMSTGMQFVNSGQVSVYASGTVGTGSPVFYTQTAGTTVVDGSMVMGRASIDGGVLQGTGNITMANLDGVPVPAPSPFTVNGGTIAPGNTTGTLTINGDLTFNSGTLLTEIGGTAAGQFDLLKITGSASFLSGTFGFSFIDGFLPQFGDHWMFLTGDGGVSGWEGLNLAVSGLNNSYSWFITPNDNGLMFHVAAIPEPEIYAMMLAGLGVLGWVGRKKKLKESTVA